MADDRPNDEWRGTEPARHADDRGISDRATSEPVGPTSAVEDSRPGVLIGLILLALFVLALVAAVVLGVIG
jgi:hypothetical protein